MVSSLVTHDRTHGKTYLVLLMLALCLPRGSHGETSRRFQLVVNAANPTTALDRSEISKIFFGRTQYWPDGHTVIPIDGAPEAQTRVAFSADIHGRSVTSVRSFWQRQIFSSSRSKPLAQAEDDQQVLKFIRSRRGAIGYVSIATPLGEGVRVLEIKDDGRGDSAQASDIGDSTPAIALLVADPAVFNVWYAALSDGGVLRSDDGGQSWSPSHEGLGTSRLRDLAAHLTHPLLVAVDGQQFYRSQDGGQLWQATGSIPAVAVEIDPSDSNVIYALTRNGLAVSLDQGTTFSELQIPARDGFSAFVVDPFGRGLFAAAGNTLWHSKRSGEGWQELSTLPIDGRTLDLAIDPVDLATIYAATTEGLFMGLEGGAKWVPLGIKDPIFTILATPSTLMATGSGVVFTSHDRGQTWDVTGLTDATVAGDPHNPNRFFALGRSGRLLSSADSGLLWRQIYHFSRQPPAADLAALPSPDRERGESSKDRKRSLPLVLACSADDEHVAALAFDPIQPSVVYAAGWRGVFKSVDFGATWAYSSQGLEIADVHALAIDPVQTKTLYAGTHGAGVFKSVDGGGRWAPSRVGLHDPTVHSLLVDPTLPSVVLAGTPSGLFVSLDSGRSWRRQGADAPGAGVPSAGVPGASAPSRAIASLVSDPADPLRWAAASSHGVLWVGDAPSLEWAPAAGQIAIDPARHQTEISPCLWDTHRDSQELMQRYGIDAQQLRLRSVLLDPRGSDVTMAATAFGLWRSGDAGDSWSLLNLRANVAAMVTSARPATSATAAKSTKAESSAGQQFGILAGTSNGLWKSADGGRKWRQSPLDQPVYSIAVDPVVPLTLYAGLDGNRLGQSRDGGQSWDVVPLDADAGHRAEPQNVVARARLIDDSEQVTPAAFGLWQALQATPTVYPRLRALIANELLARSPVVYESLVRSSLVDSLQKIRQAEEGHNPEDPQELRFSPRQRWLLARYGLASCSPCDHEIRLFDLEKVNLQASGPTPGTASWRELHDLTLEPPHLLPRWILTEPGRPLTWSANDRFLATGTGTASGATMWTWDLGDGSVAVNAGARDQVSPATLEPRSWDLGEAWNRCLTPDEAPADEAPEEILEATAPPSPDTSYPPADCTVALSGDGEWFAFATVDNNAAVGSSADGDGNAAVLRIARRRASATEVEVVWSLPVDSQHPVRWQHLRFTSDHRRLLAFASDGALWSFLVGSTADGALDPVAETGETWGDITLDPAGRWLAASTQRHLWVWSLSDSDWKPIELPVAAGIRNSLFSGDGRWLAVDSSGGDTLIFDLEAESPADSRNALERRGVLGVFSRDSKRWTSHGRLTTGILDLLPSRRRIEGSRGAATNLHLTSSRLVSAQRWGERDARRFRSQGRRWLAELRRGWIQLWDLSDHPVQSLAGQLVRRGPMGPKADPFIGPYAAWPTGDLVGLPTPALRDLACRVVARNLSVDEWRQMVGDIPWQPTCRRTYDG